MENHKDAKNWKCEKSKNAKNVWGGVLNKKGECWEFFPTGGSGVYPNLNLLTGLSKVLKMPWKT